MLVIPELLLDLRVDGEDAVAARRRLAEERRGGGGAAGGAGPHLNLVNARECGTARHWEQN